MITALMMSLLQVARQEDCTLLSSKLDVYITVGEQKWWNLRENFVQGADLTYTLQQGDGEIFKIQQPIDKLGSNNINPCKYRISNILFFFQIEIATVRSLRPFRQWSTGIWQNKFAFIEEDASQIDIYFAGDFPSETHKAPNFQGYSKAMDKFPGFTCFSIDFASSTKLIIDCAQEGRTTQDEPITTNGFLLFDLEKPTEEVAVHNSENPGKDLGVTNRIMQIHLFQPKTLGEEPVGHGPLTKTEQLYLLRGVPCYASNKYNPVDDTIDQNSIIEWYKIADDGTPDETATIKLDKAALATLFEISPTNFNFALMMFKIQPSSEVYILDAYAGIYVVGLTTSGSLKKITRYTDTAFSKAFAFDFVYRTRDDGSLQRHLVIVYKNLMILYDVTATERTILQTYNLPFTASYGTKVSLGQKFIVVSNNKVPYLYSTEHNKLITSTGFEQQDYILVNPYEPDAVALNTYQSSRYQLSDGYLINNKQVAPTTNIISTTLVAQSAGSAKQCSTILNTKILENNDKKIYDLEAQPFSPVISYPTEPISIRAMASGPNLYYVDVGPANQTVNYLVKSIWELKLDGVTIPAPQDVSYSDILVLDIQNVFFLLYQLPNKVVYIFRCQHFSREAVPAACKQYSTFSLKELLSKNAGNFYWYHQYAQLIIAYQSGKYTVELSMVEGNTQTLLKEFDYSVDKTEITSFVLLNNAIYLSLKSNIGGVTEELVEVYTSLSPIILKQRIDSNYLKTSQGYSKAFAASKVFGNKEVKSSLIFIQNRLGDLLLGEFTDTFTLIEVFPTQPSVELAVGLSSKTFFIVQYSESVQLIQEYNIQNINAIYLAKTLPLYDYKIQAPFTADFAAFTGYLFLRALDTNDKTVILLYQPNVVAHQSLHRVIEVKSKVTGTFDMAIDGQSQMIVYMNDNKEHKLFQIQAEPLFILLPSVTQPQYLNTLTAQLQVSNFQGVQTLNFTKKLKVLNTLSQLTINAAVFTKGNKKFPIKDTKSPQLVGMGTDWYSGAVVRIVGLCDECGNTDDDNVKIINPVQPVTTGKELEDFDISDGKAIGSDYVVYLTRKKLIFTYSQNNTQAKLFTLYKETESDFCEQLSISDDLQYIFVSCYSLQRMTYFIRVLKCTSITCESVSHTLTADYQDLAGVVNIIKIKYFDNSLLILDANGNNVLQYEGSVNAYQISINTLFDLTNRKVINKDYLQQLNPLYTADFEIVKYTTNNNNYYLLVLTDAKSGLVFIDSTFEGGIYKKLNVEEYNLVAYLNGDGGQYTDSNTLFYQVKTLYSEFVEKKLKVTFLVTTNNVAQYGVYFEFDASNPGAGSPIVKTSAQVPLVLTNYAQQTALNKVTVSLNTNGGIVIMPYFYYDTNRQKDVITVVAYTIPAAKPAKTTLIAFQGGEEHEYDMPQIQDFALFSNIERDGKQYFYTNIVKSYSTGEDQIIKYQVNPQAYFQIKDGSKLKSQKLTLSVVNYISDDSVSTTINNGHVDSSSSSNWWWITLLVIFGVVAVGGIGFIVYTKFFKRSGVDPLLG